MAEWKDLILADARELQIAAVITFGSGIERTLTGGEIACVTIDEGCDGALCPGAVLSSACGIDLVNDAGQWNDAPLVGSTVTLKLGASDGESVLWKNLGVFQAEGAVLLESEALLRLRCMDSVSSELREPFIDPLEYPATLAQIWHAILAQTRYVWEGTVPNGGSVVDQKPDWQGASLRTAMGMTAAAAGCFVRVDREGFLRLESLVSERQYALDSADYLRLERDDAAYGPVDALRITPVGSETEIVYRADGESALHVLSLSGNPLFQADSPHLDALARGMLGRVAGFHTRKADFTWKGDPDLRVGDRVLITGLTGGSFTAVLSRQSLRYDHRFRAECTCALPEQADSGVRRAITPEGGLNASALTGAVNGALLSVGSVTTNKLAAGAVTAEKLAAGSVDAAALNAVTAKVESLTASDIETDRLAAALAAFTVITAGTAEFDRATVQHLVAQALNLSFGTADEVFIKNLRVAYAQLVQASIGNLVIKASDGNYYRIDVGPSGNVTASPVTVTDGEISAGQTDDGRVILATNITAESLNTSNLLATYALINRIDAARIDVGELFARQAFIDLLITTDISSNSYIQQSITSTVTGEVEQFARLDSDGLHVGERDSASEVLIDAASANVVVGGRRFSSFAANYVQFGDYQMRRTADGGLAFKRKGE